MKKPFLFTFLVVVLFFCIAEIVFAKSIIADNVVHLKCSTNIFENKNALIYPNPSSISTTIFYTPDQNENISIKLYTDKGLFIDELYNAKVIVGRLYEFELRSEEMPSGIYFCIIESEHNIINKRLEIIH